MNVQYDWPRIELYCCCCSISCWYWLCLLKKITVNFNKWCIPKIDVNAIYKNQFSLNMPLKLNLVLKMLNKLMLSLKLMREIVYIYIYIYNYGDQLPLEVLFRLDRLGLWPNDPVWERGHVQGRLTKVEMEVALQEELGGIYSRPKPIRGDFPPRSICPRWLETSQSS